MPKRSRTMESAAEQAPDEANEDRRKRLRMALAVEQAVEQAIGEQMDEDMRRKLRLRLLQYYEQESAEKRNKEQNQRKVSLESATVPNVVEQPASLTMEEISKTLKGLVVMLKTQNEQDQCETSPEPDRVSGGVDVVDMAEKTTGGSGRDMDLDQDEEDDEDDDDDDNNIYHDSEDDEDSDGYSDGRGWYCLGDNDMYADQDESENEEANTPENEYIPSPWSAGDPSTPKDPFLEDSPQVDLMGTFHNERGIHNRAHQAVDPLLRDPVILSLKSEADFENYHKRPRIDFGHRWRP